MLYFSGVNGIYSFSYYPGSTKVAPSGYVTERGDDTHRVNQEVPYGRQFYPPKEGP